MRNRQLEGRTKVVVLEDGTFFIPIPDEFVQKLGLKEGDEVEIAETEIWDNNQEAIGFTISKVEDDKG